MKWLPVILGGLFGVLLREIGGWAHRWAILLIERRAKRLDETARAAFVDAATQRLTEIPGDWAKLIYTCLRLRVPSASRSSRARPWTWAPLPRSAMLTIDVLPAFVGALAMGLSLNVALPLPWYTVAGVSILWGMAIFSIDRSLVGPIRWGRGWRDVARAAVQMGVRSLVAAFVAQVVTQLLMFAIFDHEITAYLEQHRALGSGLLARSDALNHVSNQDSWVTQFRWILALIIIGLDMMPAYVRITGGGARTPRHRRRRPAPPPA